MPYNNISFVFALFFALLFIIVGISMLRNKKEYSLLIRDFSKSSGLMYMSGMFAFLFGFFIIVLNNATTPSFILVEIFGWLSLLKGMARLLFPDFTRRMMKWYSPSFVTSAGWVCLVIGIGMLLLGYVVG